MVDAISKEHIISGLIGGAVSLALGALACKLLYRSGSSTKGCCDETVPAVDTNAKVLSITSNKIPAAIGPYNPGKKIECCGTTIVITAGQIGLDPNTNELISPDVE